MGAILQRVDDDRDNLMKMTRDELRDLGKQHGIDLPPDLPHSDLTSNPQPNMVAILRARGIAGRDMSHRVLGSMQPVISELKYRNQIIPKAPPPVIQPQRWEDEREPPPVAEMTMGQLRKECKRLGIKMDRRDNMNTLRDKLREQNPS